MHNNRVAQPCDERAKEHLFDITQRVFDLLPECKRAALGEIEHEVKTRLKSTYDSSASRADFFHQLFANGAVGQMKQLGEKREYPWQVKARGQMNALFSKAPEQPTREPRSKVFYNVGFKPVNPLSNGSDKIA
ncbi:MAG: hypothetical protein ABUK01_16000 [Leptospirales bacterium]